MVDRGAIDKANELLEYCSAQLKDLEKGDISTAKAVELKIGIAEIFTSIAVAEELQKLNKKLESLTLTMGDDDYLRVSRHSFF